MIGEDAAHGRRQVGVRVEARVEEGDRHAAPRETLVRAEAQPRRQDVAALLEDRRVLLRLDARALEQLDAARAHGGDQVPARRVGRDELLRPFREPVESDEPFARLARADGTTGTPARHFRKMRRWFERDNV